MDRRTTLNILICLLLAGSILASMPMANAQTVTQVQDAAIKANQGGAAPYGSWQQVGEEVTLFIDREVLYEAADTPLGTPAYEGTNHAPIGNGNQDDDYFVHYEKNPAVVTDLEAPEFGPVWADYSDVNDKKVLIEFDPLLETYTPARWTVPVSLTPATPIRVYGFAASIWADCAADVGPDTEQLFVEFDILDLQPDGMWLRRDTSSSGGHQAFQKLYLPLSSPGLGTASLYEGEVRFGNPAIDNGQLFDPTKMRMQFSVAPGGFLDYGLCVVHFGSASFPSFVRVLADSARLNMWNENPTGEVTEGASSASRTASEKRRFLTQVIHASAWPQLNSYRYNRTDPVNYLDDFWDLSDDAANVPDGPGDVVQASSLSFRVRNLQNLNLISGTGADQIQTLSRQAFDIGNSVNRVQYELFYPENLPDGRYRSEAFSDEFGQALTPDITIGLKGFTFTPLDGLTHTINPGEATDFRFRVRNFGGEDDTVTVVATPPGNSWSAEVIGASTHFLKASGGEAEIVLRVTSPATALVGAPQSVSMSAASSTFPGELPAIARTVTVNVVSAVERDVEVTANRTVLTIQPGVDTALGGIRVQNLGTARDSFVLQPDVPASAQGWTVQATPLSKEILADSSSDFSVRIRAPTTAQAGQSFTLGLTANRLGDLTVTDRVDITVIVQILHGMVLAPYETTIDLRSRETCPAYPVAQPQPAPAPVVPNAPGNQCATTSAIPLRDNDFDRSAVFRVVLENPAGISDTYRITGMWKRSGTINGVGISDSAGLLSCGDGEGWPDFWRYEFGNGAEPKNAPDNTGNFVRNIELRAGERRELFLELGYLHSNGGAPPSHQGCQSQAAGMTLTFRSMKDPSKEQAVLFGAFRMAHGAFEGTNDYASAARGVEIFADLNDTDAKAGANPGQKAQHTFRVVNKANEKDNLLVQVPAGTGGWTRQLQHVNSVPSGPGCSALNVDRTRFLCSGMGVNDEQTFRLNVTSASTSPIGQNDRALVSVTSGDDGSISDDLEFLTTTMGTFQFDAQALRSLQQAEKGKTALLPFVLKNLGTSGDRLNLSLVVVDAAWTPRLGLPDSNFVPGGKDLSGFISVQVPSTATENTLFRLKVTSQGNGAIDTIDMTVKPISVGALRIAGVPSNITTIERTGVGQKVELSVTDTGPAASAGRVVDLTIVPGAMPSGWTVTPEIRTVTLNGGTPTAVGNFTVTAPVGALGNSRVPFQVRAASTNPSVAAGQGDLLLQLADTFGVKLAADGPTAQTIVPGGQVVYNMTVENLGTSTDTIRMSTSAPPTGWVIQTDPAEISLGPLENGSMTLLVRAPSNAAPRALAATTLQAASLGSGAVSSVAVTTKVGFYEINVTAVDSGLIRLAPTETGSRVYSIKNNGSVADEVVVTPALLNAGLASHVTLKSDPATITLEPNQTKQVRLDITLGPGAPSDSTIAAKAFFASRLAPVSSPANVTLPLDLQVVRYVALDADGDGINEYAVDRDGPDNGYEGFLDTGAGGGKASRLADLGRFLTDSARADATKSVALANGTTVEIFDLVVDGDGDKLRDLFIDSTGDGLPDHYWDPDGAKRQDLTTVKDIDADAVPDYFVDTDGALGFDAVYNLRTGAFTDLLSIDIDGDGTTDFVVDGNGNGKLDADETVLFSRNGQLLSVLKVDMDGNGELDDVFDTDGDGVPDYFIPAGEEDAVEIVLRDMNGDGKADWAYDTDGDGRVDAYYDPATGESHLVDARGGFKDALTDYWYIGALFGLVLVLFVVLLLVTRR